MWDFQHKHQESPRKTRVVGDLSGDPVFWSLRCGMPQLGKKCEGHWDRLNNGPRRSPADLQNLLSMAEVTWQICFS